MSDILKRNLQMFADGGDGGGDGAGTGAAMAGVSQAADSGVKADDPGRQRLRELGVPESKLRKNRVYSKPAAQAKNVPAAAANAEPSSGADGNTPTEEAKTPRMTWEEIKADPEYSKAYKDEVSATVQSRLKNSKAKEAALEHLTPALEILAKAHGMDPANIDYEALSKAIMDDDSLYDEKALELGVSRETAKQLEQFELEKARNNRIQQETAKEQMYRQHFEKLQQQGEALKQSYPGFNLQKELENPAFARMTAPGSGLSVEDAYFAIHRKEIQQAQAQAITQKTAEQMANAIRSNSARPRESGASSQAPSVTTFDYRNASAAQRNELKRQIRMAAARGEKIYPGQFTGK